jgi:hypothetical protein
MIDIDTAFNKMLDDLKSLFWQSFDWLDIVHEDIFVRDVFYQCILNNLINRLLLLKFADLPRSLVDSFSLVFFFRGIFYLYKGFSHCLSLKIIRCKVCSLTIHRDPNYWRQVHVPRIVLQILE